MREPSPGRAGRHVALRPAVDADRAFLRAVYGSTRADELALVPWTEAEKQAFVDHQFEAQDRHYRQYYPDATFDVVLVDGCPAGRLYVDRRSAEIRIVDVALLPHHRSAGTGTVLLRGVMDEAAASGRKVSIHVERFNPALRLYTRLGFVPVGDTGVHLLLEWTPQAPAGSGEDGLVAHAGGVRAEGDEEDGELAEAVVAQRDDLLLDVTAVGGMEQQREGGTAGAGPLLGKPVAGLLARGEDEVERRSAADLGTEGVADERGERFGSEALEHVRQARRTAIRS